MIIKKIPITLKQASSTFQQFKKCWVSQKVEYNEKRQMDRDLFIGYCWGAAGSAWLARLLNSHEDILCLHVPDFPRLNYRNYDDLTAVLDSIVYTSNQLVRVYSLVGFTHGIPADWHSRLKKKYDKHLRGFVLTRHPIKRIQSSFELNKNNPKRSNDKLWQQSYRRVYDQLVRQSGKHFPDDFAALGFYLSCDMVGNILLEDALGLPIYKFEDIIGNPQTVNDLVAYVSDGMYQFENTRVEQIQKDIVAKHARDNLSVAETYSSWSDVYKEAYYYLVREKVCEIYSQLGYTFPHSI